jgi:rhombotail lipoprotein
MVRRMPVFLAILALSGCFARGFDHSTLTTQLQPTPVINEEEIAKVQSLKPQLTFPCRVAVYLPPQINGRWNAKEREIVDSWEASLKKEGIVSEMFVMAEMLTRGAEAKSPKMIDLRVAAAKHGANSLLVIQGDCDVKSYDNPAALFNLTIIGGYVVPASHRDALVTLQGALVDVGNGFLYASFEAQGEGKVIRPSFIVEEQPAVERAKVQALVNFGPELLKRMRNVRANFAQIPASANAALTAPTAPVVTAPPVAAQPWKAPETPANPTTPAAATIVPVSANGSSIQPIPANPAVQPLPADGTIKPIIIN